MFAKLALCLCEHMQLPYTEPGCWSIWVSTVYTERQLCSGILTVGFHSTGRGVSRGSKDLGTTAATSAHPPKALAPPATLQGPLKGRAGREQHLQALQRFGLHGLCKRLQMSEFSDGQVVAVGSSLWSWPEEAYGPGPQLHFCMSIAPPILNSTK